MKTITVDVTSDLIAEWGGSGAMVEAIQLHLMPGCMAFPGCLNLTIFQDARDIGDEGWFGPLPADVLRWLAVADRGEDEMPPMRFDLQIPLRYLRDSDMRRAA